MEGVLQWYGLIFNIRHCFLGICLFCLFYGSTILHWQACNSPCSSGWPQTWEDLLASASQVLWYEVLATTRTQTLLLLSLSVTVHSTVTAPRPWWFSIVRFWMYCLFWPNGHYLHFYFDEIQHIQISTEKHLVLYSYQKEIQIILKF